MIFLGFHKQFINFIFFKICLFFMIFYGFFLDFLWIFYGFFMDFLWILYGFIYGFFFVFFFSSLLDKAKGNQ